MPIDVHCPNPACARVHKVKSKYAGMRGKCPACGSWMYIPKPEQPALPVTPPPQPEEPPAWMHEEVRQSARAAEPARQPVAAGANHQAFLMEDEPPLLPETFEEKPARGRARPAVEEDEPAVEAVEEAEEAQEEKSKPHFSWLAVVLMVLGVLALGAFAAAPYLPAPTVSATGELAKLLTTGKDLGIQAEFVPYVLGAPGVVAGIIFLNVLLGLITRRFGILNLFLLYLGALASAFLLLLGLTWFHDETGPNGNIPRLKERAERLRANGTPGEITASEGYQYYAMAGGAAGACLFFTLAGLFLHRRLWSRMLGFFFLAFWPALMAAWVYRSELGIGADLTLPFDLPRFWGTWLL